MYNKPTIIQLEIEQLLEVEPREVMRARTELTIKVVINKHQIIKALLDSLDDFLIGDLNSILKGENLVITELSEPPKTKQRN